MTGNSRATKKRNQSGRSARNTQDDCDPEESEDESDDDEVRRTSTERDQGTRPSMLSTPGSRGLDKAVSKEEFLLEQREVSTARILSFLVKLSRSAKVPLFLVITFYTFYTDLSSTG